MAELSADTWREFGRRLREAGLDASFFERCWGVPSRSYESLQWPIRLARTRHLEEPAAYACRMLMLRDPVTEREAAAVFGTALVERLLTAGLLIRPDAQHLVSAFDCKWFMNLLILCDDLAYQSDAVFGAGPGTLVFGCMLDSDRVIDDALDIGCGAGAVSLCMARHARRVVAIDINPRALVFLTINAAINDVANVEARLGDLFGPVAGEMFDLIVSQPPFVPRPPGARSATYLFGGAYGNELVLRIASGIPRYLRRGGRAVIVFERAVMADQGKTCTERTLAVDETMQTLVIVGAEVNAEAYAIRHASDDVRRGIDEFDRTATGMYEHLQDLHIRGLCPSICVMEHAEQSPGWIVTLHAGMSLWNEVSVATIDRLLAGNRLARESTERLRQARLRIPEGSLVIRPVSKTEPRSVYLRPPTGYLFSSLEFATHEWDLIESLHRGQSIELPADIVAKAARAGLIDV
jgi:tRNA1(Val) A37 N6-methylase TrmN6